jgi:hypothetical protein
MAEDTSIERLVLDPHGSEQMVGAEIDRSHAAEPERGVGQGAVKAGEAVVDDETGRIDNHFAGVDLGENRERLRGTGSPD